MTFAYNFKSLCNEPSVQQVTEVSKHSLYLTLYLKIYFNEKQNGNFQRRGQDLFKNRKAERISPSSPNFSTRLTAGSPKEFRDALYH